MGLRLRHISDSVGISRSRALAPTGAPTGAQTAAPWASLCPNPPAFAQSSAQIRGRARIALSWPRPSATCLQNAGPFRRKMQKGSTQCRPLIDALRWAQPLSPLWALQPVATQPQNRPLWAPLRAPWAQRFSMAIWSPALPSARRPMSSIARNTSAAADQRALHVTHTSNAVFGPCRIAAQGPKAAFRRSSLKSRRRADV